MDRRARLVLLASLYFSQGLPFGFFTLAVPVMLRQQGLSLEKVALASLAALPWALKFLWSPWVDRWGTRRSWLLPLQALAVLNLSAISLLEPRPDRLLALAAAMAITNLLAATQDIATDGFAVDLLAEADRGVGNGLQVGAYRFGMIVGGGGLLALYGRLGWVGACLTMAALLAVASVPVWFAAEPPKRVGPAVGYAKALSRLTRQPGASGWFTILLVYKFGEAMGSNMVRLFLTDAHWPVETIGLLLGFGGSGAGMLGALLGGIGVQRLGRQRSLIAFGLLQAAAVAAWALPAVLGASGPLVIAVCLLEHVASGLATTALFTAMMDRCDDPTTTATDYTLQASFIVFATIMAASVGGFSAANLGWPLHFVVGALACVAAATLVATRSIPEPGPKVPPQVAD